MEPISELLKKYRNERRLTQDELADELRVARRTYQYWENGRNAPSHAHLLQIAQVLHVDPSVFGIDNATNPNPEPYIKKRYTAKNAPSKDEGVVFVPISAQAGYRLSYLDPVYINQLERIIMPGFPFRGNRYRVFEVDGSSMEPTFKEGYFVLCEKVDPDQWVNIPNYYCFVIITEDQILLKRVFKKNDAEFVMISDNEEFYPQFILDVSRIKEIWQVKRKMDWEMSPPKKFDITV